MDKIKRNTLVSMSLKLENKAGDIIDDSDEFMYLHGGYKQIFQKLEDLLDGKEVGAHFRLVLTSAQGFGEYDESLVLKELLENLPEDIAVGMELDGEDKEMIYVVERIEQEYAILNANHPLAGIEIVASGEILEIEHLSDEAVEEVLKAEDHH